MNVNVFVSLIGILSLIIGIFIGTWLFKFYSKKLDKKLLEHAEEVLSGKRDNKIKIDGEEHDASKFRLRDGNDKEILIDLKKGGKIQDGREQEASKEESTTDRCSEDDKSSRENSNSIREGERIVRKKKRSIRGIISRIRRFG